MRIALLLFTIILGAVAATPADAALVNGGFESGNLSGWLASGGVSIGPSLFLAGGSFEADLSSTNGNLATLSQSFSIGAPSMLDFQYSAGAGTQSGSSVVFALTNVDTSSTVNLDVYGPGSEALFDPPFDVPSISHLISTTGNYIFSVSVLATGITPSYATLDNVTLTAVPEASTWVLAMCGAAAIAAFARHKRAAC